MTVMSCVGLDYWYKAKGVGVLFIYCSIDLAEFRVAFTCCL